MTVPKFVSGVCEVRRSLDEAVAEATEWDLDDLT